MTPVQLPSPVSYCHHHPHADNSTVCVTRAQQHLASPWQVTTAFSFVLTQPAAWPGTATQPALVLSTRGHTANIPFPPYKIPFKMPAILAKMIKKARDTCIGATSDFFFFFFPCDYAAPGRNIITSHVHRNWLPLLSSWRKHRPQPAFCGAHTSQNL